MRSLAVSDRYGWSRYVGHQVYYAVIGRDWEQVMPLGIDRGVGAIKWSPLGWGRLTGKILRGHPLPAESRLHKTAAQAGGAELVTATAHDVNGHHRRPQ
jgi:aryl-alcohol dehydrogenase-like predicted oxidoreductase